MPDAKWNRVLIAATDFSCKRSARQIWLQCKPANLYHLQITFAGIIRSSFSNAALDDAVFIGSDEMPVRRFGLLQDDFSDATMQGVDFQTTAINDTKFDRTLLKGAQFQRIFFSNKISFGGANLQEAFFNLISFDPNVMINLTEANFTGATFDFRELVPSDFPHATLGSLQVKTIETVRKPSWSQSDAIGDPCRHFMCKNLDFCDEITAASTRK